jgi:phage gp29-like protein
MAQILDQYGKPIRTSELAEPQTARLSHLVNHYLESSLDGLTPARLSSALRMADAGDLLSQHRIFADMEERDVHLAAEMGKRKNALLGLDWDIVPGRNATAAEKANAEWAKEMLQDAIDPLEDLISFLMEAVGHGFACSELEWQRQGSEWLPIHHPRPQEWFRLDQETCTELRLNDVSREGQALRSFGWVWHVPGKPKTGYGARMGLYRALVWPFIYKAYAVGDFAEFLETFGLPIIIGKYFNGATAAEKASLFRAVTALGHDARAIMPIEMQIEVQKITGGSGGSETPHLAMVEWADKAQSKAILGGTLTSQADGKTSTNALGNVHNDVRKDILRSDARQIAATLTRDLIYPLIALNRGGIEDLRRCPRLVFDLGEAEDLALYAEALPKLVGSGVKTIPVSWVHEKLRIPQPIDNEPTLGAPAPVDPPANPAKKTVATLIAALSAQTADDLAQKTVHGAGPASDSLVETIAAYVDAAPDMKTLQTALLNAYGGLDSGELERIMAAAFALAELQGMADVRAGA